MRKPLVVMTPKSLLRHPAATSTLEQLAAGPFQAVIPEDEDLDPDAVRRVVLCSGKVCYDLLARRAERAERRVALVRVELLHPFPHDAVDQALQAWPVDAEVVWCQEEPRNMGAWPMALHWFLDRPRGGRLPRYVGRAASAATATGSYRRHQQEQARLVDEALTL